MHAASATDLTGAVTIAGGSVTVDEIAEPSTPASGKVVLFAKADGKLYIKDDTGTVTALGGAFSPDISLMPLLPMIEEP